MTVKGTSQANKEEPFIPQKDIPDNQVKKQEQRKPRKGTYKPRIQTQEHLFDKTNVTASQNIPEKTSMSNPSSTDKQVSIETLKVKAEEAKKKEPPLVTSEVADIGKGQFQTKVESRPKFMDKFPSAHTTAFSTTASSQSTVVSTSSISSTSAVVSLSPIVTSSTSSTASTSSTSTTVTTSTSSASSIQSTTQPPVKKSQTNDVANFKQTSADEFDIAFKYISHPSSLPKFNDQNDIMSWNFERDGQKYEINNFLPGAYNDVKTEDFLKRIELLKDAAIRHIINRKKESPNREQYIGNVEKLVKKYEEAIKKQCSIDKDRIDEDKYFDKIHSKAEDIITELAFVLTNLEGMPLNEKNEKFNLADLAQSEIDCVIERGRPIIINIYTIKGKKFVSMQTPLSKTMLPSTARDREGLANYVRTSFGVLNESGEITILYSGIRHGIYSPYLIEDENIRQAVAANNVKENLKKIAEGMMQNSETVYTQDNPLVIPLRTMTIVTVKKGDKVRDESLVTALLPDLVNKAANLVGWKGESESTQLLETVLALRTYNNQIFQLEVNGQKIWVKPDISMMNLGSNVGATEEVMIGKVPDRKFLKKLNARGFNTLVGDIKTALEKVTKDHGMKTIGDMVKFLSIIPPQIEHEINKFHKKYDEVLKQQYKILNDNQLAYNENLLARKTIIDTKFDDNSKKEIIKQDLDIKIENNMKEIKQSKQKIDEIEGELDEIQLKLIENRKNIQENNKKKFQELIKNIKQELTNNTTPKTAAHFKNIEDLLELFSQAQSIFFEERFRKADHVMDFQVLFNLMQGLLEKINEFNCKSSEDRTGRLDDKMQEFMIFHEIDKKYPDTYDEDDMKKLNEYAVLVHQYSASQNNTEQNSNARGEQIGDIVNPDLKGAAGRGKKMAGLAKKPLKKAAKLKVSDLQIVNSLNLEKIVSS